MKKTFIGIALAVVLVSVFASTTSVFARAEVPPTAPAGAGRGRMAGTVLVNTDPLYLNHDEMINALVDLTGLSATEIEERIAAGETAYEIAISQNVSPEDFYAVLPMGGYGVQAAGQMNYGRADVETAPRFQMQENTQSFYQDGTCLVDGEPQPLNLNLLDGSGAGRSGRWNR